MASSSRVISGKGSIGYESCLLPRLDQGSQSNVRLVTPRQIETAQREAYNEGVNLGRKDAYNRFSSQLQSIVASISETLVEFDEKTLQQLASMILTCSRQLIRHQLTIDPGMMVSVVRESLKLLPLTEREVTILMHPEDCAVVREAFETDGRKSAINIIPDAVMSRGSCVVMSDESRIDATIESRMEAVVSQMLDTQHAAGRDD
jgi:flagellar assembly protein FliH